MVGRRRTKLPRTAASIHALKSEIPLRRAKTNALSPGGGQPELG
jgi:hypothetical protein